MSNLFKRLGAAIAVFMLMVGAALAQVPSVPGPYNYLLTNSAGTSNVVIQNTLRTAGTTNSQTFTNLNGAGISCTFNRTAESGDPSTTFSVQEYDAASATWADMMISSAITGATASTAWRQVMQMFPGIAVASLPTNYNKAVNLHLPRTFRIQQVIAGTSGPAETGTIGCQVLQ